MLSEPDEKNGRRSDRLLEDFRMRWNFHIVKPPAFAKYMFHNEFLGWLMGLEPTTTGITIRDSTKTRGVVCVNL
jgi:ribosomal protein L21E